MRQLEIGCTLKCARQSLRLSVATASRLLGVSTATVKRWEAGQGLPSNAELHSCLDRLGVHAESPARELLHRSTNHRTDRGGREPHGDPTLRLLRAKRRRNGLTLEDVCLATGISLASLHRYETGERVPDARILRILGATVGCDNVELELLEGTRDLDLEVSLVDRFLTPDANPHFWVYCSLACYSSSQGRTHATSRKVVDLVHAFFLMGDHAGAVEAWALLKPLALQLEFDREQRAILTSSLALARLTMGDSSDGHVKFGKCRDLVDRLDPTSDGVRAMLHIVRIASTLGLNEDAMSCLRRVEQHAGESSDTNLMFVCDLNRLDLEFDGANPDPTLRRVAELRAKALGRLQPYNADVATLGMLSRLGSHSDLSDIAERCRTQEQAFGVGSPLANRIIRGVLRA